MLVARAVVEFDTLPVEPLLSLVVIPILGPPPADPMVPLVDATEKELLTTLLEVLEAEAALVVTLVDEEETLWLPLVFGIAGISELDGTALSGPHALRNAAADKMQSAMRASTELRHHSTYFSQPAVTPHEAPELRRTMLLVELTSPRLALVGQIFLTVGD